MKPEVRAHFPEFSVKFEGRVPTMYADVLGLITCGVGNLIDPVSVAMHLPFRHANGSLAAPSEIAAEWQRLKAMDLGRYHWRVQAARAGLQLHLSDDDIDTLVREKLDDNEQILTRFFPDFEEWPAEAQLATLSMAWAMGAGFPSTWPRFTAAARAHDWAACAENCKIREVAPNGTPNPGVIPRNKANAALFRAAANPPVPRPAIDANDRARIEYLNAVMLDELRFEPTVPNGEAES